MPSPSNLLIHVVGLIAVSQLIFSGHSEQHIYGRSLNKNVTEVLHEALDAVLGSFSAALPFSSGAVNVGLVIKTLMYSATTLYILYIARKVYNASFGVAELYCPEIKAGFDYPHNELAKGLSKRDFVNQVRRRRKFGEIPPPFPNGWFAIHKSCDLKPGQSTAVNALGQNFAVFRDDNGKAHVLDAYCAHLGANLGVGGMISGSCIECPFHGWQFDGETGQCTKIPYSKGKIPTQAKVKAWPTLETNGFVHVWHDAEGRDPYWFPTNIEGVNNGKMVYRVLSTHFMNVHVEEISENGADVAHLNVLHSAGISSGSGMNFRDLLSGKLHTHTWTALWEQLPEPSTHIGRMTLTMINTILGVRVDALNLTAVTDQNGPGIVYITMKSMFGTIMLLHSVTPLEPFLQKFTLMAYSDWWIPTFIVKWIVQGYDVQLERDIIVWNNKSYNIRPILVREDELILKHRRWYSQFYSEKSRRLAFKKDSFEF